MISRAVFYAWTLEQTAYTEFCTASRRRSSHAQVLIQLGAGVLGIWAKKCKEYGQNMENKEPMGRVKGQRDMVIGHQSLVPSSSVWVWTGYAILWGFCWLSWKMRPTIIVIHERWVHRWKTCRNHPVHSKWSPKVSHLGGKMWCGCFQTQMFVFWWLTSPALMSSKHKGCIFWTIPKWSMTLFKREWEAWLSHRKGSWLKPWKEFH